MIAYVTYELPSVVIVVVTLQQSKAFILRLRPCRRPPLLACRLTGLLAYWLRCLAGCYSCCILEFVFDLDGYCTLYLNVFGMLFACYGGFLAHFGSPGSTLGSTLTVFWVFLGNPGESLGAPWAHVGGIRVHFRVPGASKSHPKWSRMPFG